MPLLPIRTRRNKHPCAAEHTRPVEAHCSSTGLFASAPPGYCVRLVYFCVLLKFVPMPTLRFRKAEKLTDKRAIAMLFAQGQSRTQFPLRMVYLPARKDQGAPAKVLFAVPKRHFKRANRRNLLRRRLREAYRLQRQLPDQALQSAMPRWEVLFIYIGKKPLPYTRIYEAMGLLLNTLHASWTPRADAPALEANNDEAAGSGSISA